MDAEQKREVWGDYNATDLAIAKLLAPIKGWKVLEGEGAAFFTNSREWVSACLVVGDDEQFREIPRFTDDLNAVDEALPEHMHLIIEPVTNARGNVLKYAATLMNPRAESSSLNIGRGSTRQAAAGAALEAYLTAKRAEGKG